MSLVRTRWASIGAAVAITFGAGGIGLVSATRPDGASTLVTITPCRLADTRAGSDNVGPRSTPLGAGDTLVIDAHGTHGNCVIPAAATALSLNVTSVGATQASFLTIWQTGAAQPQASSVNPTPGEPPTPNAATTSLSAGGQFSIFNLAGAVDVIVDVNGYYVAHDHDDRYYTKQQSDALRYGIRTDNRIAVHQAEFTPTSLHSEATGGPTSWARYPVLLHESSGLVECVTAPILLPPGRTVTEVHVTYAAGAGASVTGFVAGSRTFPGQAASGIDGSDLATIAFPPTASDILGDGLLPVLAPSPAIDGYDYALTLCTSDAIGISGVTMQLA